jgi:O-antigen/teichoic acid export membrane protein
MKRHLTNAGYGVLDYVSYPLGMLLVAPIVLHRLGAAEYGLWMVATAFISAGSIVAAGCCDACIQRVAYLRGSQEFRSMHKAVESMLGINLTLGIVLAASLWIAAPYAAFHITATSHISIQECVTSLRICGLCIVSRSIESVGVGVRRAFEDYRGAVQISTAMRLLSLASAAILAMLGKKIAWTLAATVLFLILEAYLQFRQPRKLLSRRVFLPVFDRDETRLLLGRGIFVWLQTLGSVVFNQLDRILLGVFFGALAVAPYSLCVQFAHPIFGLTASGLNFVFPYISSRTSAIASRGMKRTLLKVFACNLLLVASGTGSLLFFGAGLIRLWAGPAVALSAAPVLAPIVIGSALMGLSVTGTYSLQALGKFKTVAYISLAGKAAMLVVMLYLIHRHGLQGLATARLYYGAVALLVYLPLLRELNPDEERSANVLPVALPLGAQEGSKP